MDILKKTEYFARKRYKKNNKFHQYTHVEAVLKRSLEIIKNMDNSENIDLEALKLAIIFHDIDYSSYETHVDNSVKVAEKFLNENNYPKTKIKRIIEIMYNHSTPHQKRFGKAKLIEGKIMYDADKSLFITKIYMTDKKTYKKYFSKLYLKETKSLMKIK